MIPGLGSLIRRKGAAAPPAFTPLDLPGLVHYWHAVDSPKTGHPGAISQINDLVGSLHLVQAAGAAQPTSNTRTINGKIALDFDGTDDAMRVATGPSVTANGLIYVFGVWKFDSFADADMLFHTGGASAANDGCCLELELAAGRLRQSWANGTTQSTWSPAAALVGTTTPHFIEYWIDGNIGNFAVDGVDQAGFTHATTPHGYATPEETDWFNRGGTLNELDGAGCEWGIVADTMPSAGDRVSMLSYMRTEWGTP
jgi:hypothetical protein